MTRYKHKVKISWGEDSREPEGLSHALWLVRHLIQLGVPDIRIECAVDKSPSKGEVEKVIGKVGPPIKSPKDGVVSKRGGRKPGQPRFSGRFISKPK